jgi:peroxiredoxin
MSARQKRRGRRCFGDALWFGVTLLNLASACSPRAEPGEIDLTAPGLEQPLEPERPIEPDIPVPAFRVNTTQGKLVDSRELVGKQAFMLVYFATWCRVCRMKLPMVKFVLERYHPDLAVYGVVMDDSSTWQFVPSYVERYDIDFELIQAERFPRFAAAYSPSGLVPAVTLVSKQGYVLEYQHGYSQRHLPELVAALAESERLSH